MYRMTMKPAMAPRVIPTTAAGAGPELRPAYVVGMARTMPCRLCREVRGSRNMGSWGVGIDVRGERERASLMARRVILPVPFTMVANTDANGGGPSLSVALEERDRRERENRWRR